MGGLGGVLGASWGALGGSWGRLGALLGGLGELLRGSWAVLGRSWCDFWSSPISYRFFDRFWSRKGCQKGGVLGAKMEPKSIPKRGRNLRAKKLSLGSGLGRSWVDLGPLRSPKSCSRPHGGHFFKIHMFRLFGPPRAILDRKWLQLRGQEGAKIDQNSHPNFDRFSDHLLIDF